ncbi:hypothetical protein IJI76_01685 [Candidatus Saccharibacteria bacterium]|nr:hypothetical protein [Candidatus Saccharibacteria bacterium]
MSILKKLKRALLFPLVGLLFATSALNPSTPVYAEPVENTTTVTTEVPEVPNTPSETTPETPSDDPETPAEEGEEDGDKTEGATCYSQVGGLGYILCPAMAFLSKTIDTIYGVIEDFLVVEPISMEENSPVFTIWVYVRNITNIVFILFFLFIIYSQITGFGISNYGIKKALPRLIVAAILVNLSFIICAIAVDLSNIIGKSLYDFLNSVANDALANGFLSGGIEGGTASVSFYSVFTAVAAGGVIGSLAVGLSGGPLGLLLSLIPVILSGIISIIIAFVTIALRQAVIILLVTIAPLAFVAYLLPNTEKYFKKWTDIFSQMLFFYPLFALLFGASKLASWILISSANSMLGVILGLAIQVAPLFLALNLLKMSGSILGKVSSGLDRLGQRANSGIRTATDPYKNLAKQQSLNRAMQKPFNPLSGASWRAAAKKQQTNIKFRQDQADKTQSNLQAEQLNALRRNQRIIGYDKNNQPIYTQVPFRNGKSNKYMDAEAEAREVDLRLQADNLAVENAYGSLGDYQKEHGIKKGRATKNASRMGEHYKSLRTQMTAKQRNDEADERYYNESVMQAAERYEFDDENGAYKAGDIKDQAAYNRLVKGALGSQGYNINQRTAEGKRLAEQAAVNVIGDAYSRNEAQRAGNIKRFETYMGKQVTKEVVRQYEDMIKYDNIDGIIAAHNVLSMRGDYDKIAEHMRDYMNSGKIKLGEDAANVLALNFLGMKDSAPALARLGKFMNMETWAYTDGKRKTKEITMEQYVTGTIKGDHRNEKGQLVDYTTKIKMATGLEGTRLNGIDRTAYGVNDAMITQFDLNEDNIKNMSAEDRKKAIKQAYTGRLEVETAMMPQEISALPTFASGSEQIRSMVGHLVGMKYDSKTGRWKNTIRTGANGEVDRAITDYTTATYLKSLTVRDLINMKTDTWNGLVSRYSYDYLVSQGYNPESDDVMLNEALQKEAEEAAHEVLRKHLETRVAKLAEGNMNVDMMREKIYNALRIGERREEVWNQRRAANRRNGHTNGQEVQNGERPVVDAMNPDDPFNPTN